MFGLKVQRGGGDETSPVVDDAGILFAFSLRDRSKTKEIKGMIIDPQDYTTVEVLNQRPAEWIG